MIVLCVIGFAALWKRKRTLLAFDLFLIGFALTQFIELFGFAFIFLGGFLLLRAWRINKYGTTDSKVIRRVAATQPRGRQRKEATRSTSKAASTPAHASLRPPASGTPRRPRPGRRSPKRPSEQPVEDLIRRKVSRPVRSAALSATVAARPSAGARANALSAPPPRLAAPPPP